MFVQPTSFCPYTWQEFEQASFYESLYKRGNPAPQPRKAYNSKWVYNYTFNARDSRLMYVGSTNKGNNVAEFWNEFQ
jgi:hypothetical protein